MKTKKKVEVESEVREEDIEPELVLEGAEEADTERVLQTRVDLLLAHDLLLLPLAHDVPLLAHFYCTRDTLMAYSIESVHNAQAQGNMHVNTY